MHVLLSFFSLSYSAILKLAEPIHFDGLRAQVSLSLVHENKSKVYLTGWGENSAGLVTKNLHFLAAKSIGSGKCQLLYQALYRLCTTQYGLSAESPMAHITRV